jgi:DNA modification methylase
VSGGGGVIHTGDCIEVMAGMPADSVDAVVTDPPYGLEFMGRDWDSFKATGVFAGGGHSGLAEGKGVLTAPRFSAGHPFQAWCEAWGREALRVTKPGGYLLAFGGTRTHHRLVCGLEDAGWIIRDELDWVYASGFPKGKANLKPAHEPIVLARKPGPLRHLAIDECRIGMSEQDAETIRTAGGFMKAGWDKPATEVYNSNSEANPMPTIDAEPHQQGRWPSNLLLSDPELFDVANPYVVGSGATSEDGVAVNARRDGVTDDGVTYGYFPHQPGPDAGYGGGGGYSRFFLVPKSSRADREPTVKWTPNRRRSAPDSEEPSPNSTGSASEASISRVNVHPTCKPTDLMRHLVRLVTPQGGTVLDPFLGSGSTAIACELEGFPWIGIEQDASYVAIAEARLNGVQRGLGLDVPAPTIRSRVIRSHAQPLAWLWYIPRKR